MRAAITGAAGLVGSALARAVPEAVALTHSALDVADRDAAHGVIATIRPEVVFNCAVVGVDPAERDPELAEQVNVRGAGNLAAAAAAAGAVFVHFSTNYVFDGELSEGAYTTEDEPSPLSVYGRTKLEGERAATAAHPSTFVIRTSWVFGSGKSSFLSTVPSILRRGEPVTAITDLFANTTYVEDLVARVLEIVRIGRPGIYHVVNEGLCSYERFALEAARLTGADPSLVRRIAAAEAGHAARRPRFTPMRCVLSEDLGLAPVRDWREALAEYVAHP